MPLMGCNLREGIRCKLGFLLCPACGANLLGQRAFRLAYRSGVTRAVTAPSSNGFLAGLSTTFDTGAVNAIEKGAVVQAETALHVAVSLNFDASISTQIATLRRLLTESSVDAWRAVRKVHYVPVGLGLSSDPVHLGRETVGRQCQKRGCHVDTVDFEIRL